jgi:cell wall-associated NlpC family hydrolase
MHDTNEQQRPAPRRRRLRIGVTAGAIALSAWAGLAPAPASAAPRPARIAGDHHSPRVVDRATAALAAHERFEITGTPADFVAYLRAREATADAVAAEMQLDPTALRLAWSRADLQHQKAVLAALTQLGVQYRSATSAPGIGFDCSGLTAFAWGRAGVQLARQSGAQINAAAPRDESTAVAGDLLQYPGHVMMYLGVDRAIVHASNPANDVELSFVTRAVRFGDPTG